MNWKEPCPYLYYQIVLCTSRKRFEQNDPHEHFKAWQRHKEQLKHEREQHKKYVKIH